MVVYTGTVLYSERESSKGGSSRALIQVPDEVKVPQGIYFKDTDDLRSSSINRDGDWRLMSTGAALLLLFVRIRIISRSE